MQRDVLIIGSAIAAAIIIGSLLFFFAAPEPALAPVGEEQGVTVAVIDEGTHAALDERKNFRIMDGEQLAAVWAHAYGDNAPPMPRIDFTRHEVLAVFDGERPTGGYAVLVSKVIDEPDARTVVITRLEPGEGCVTTQALTTPFQLVRVPRSDKEIEREEEVVEVPCE